MINLDSLTDSWYVSPEGEGVFRVTGANIEGFAKRTNFDQDEGVARLRDIMKRQGITRELRRLGALDGDTVRIGETEFAWLD